MSRRLSLSRDFLDIIARTRQQSIAVNWYSIVDSHVKTQFGQLYPATIYSAASNEKSKNRKGDDPLTISLRDHRAKQTKNDKQHQHISIMLTKFTSLIAAFTLVWGSASAVNLRNGPKDLSVDLNGLVGSSGDLSHARRKLAMRGLADFNWEVQPEPDYPSISFEGAGDQSEIRFLYNYTGTTDPDTKYLKHELLQGDCKTPASTGALVVSFSEDITGNKEYQVDVDILQASIAGTPEYMDIDVTSAMINFCIRVDYVYNDGTDPEESINFHETNVTINIDLTANFTLTAINVDRIDADQVDEDVALDCEVQAYFCNQNNENIGQPRFVQGEIMTVCVEIADSDRALYHLNDVMDMDLEQTQADRISIERSDVVVDQRATGLSDKFCKNGICNIRH